MHKILESVDKILNKAGINKSQKIYVAVSGGSDSVALLHLISLLGYRSHLLHLNHSLRDVDSNKDQAFVEDLADKLDIPISVTVINVKELAAKKSISIEMAGRLARHEFFRSLPSLPIALAHHADDQVENFLLRLTRGASRSGLSGMQSKQTINGLTLIRPLLNIRKKDLIKWLKENKFDWREDESNANQSFKRNQIRHQILPLMKTLINPNLSETIIRNMKAFHDEDLWLEQETLKYDHSNISNAPIVLQRRWVRSWLFNHDIDEISFDACEQIVKAINKKDGSRKCDVNNDYHVEIAYGEPFLISNADENVPKWNLKSIPGTGWIEDHGQGAGILPARASVSMEKVSNGEIYARKIEPGDRFQPLGMKGYKKIQDILVDQKIPASQRKFIPVVCFEDEIIWLPGYCIASSWSVKDQQSPALHLTISIDKKTD